MDFNPLGPIAPKVTRLTLYCFVASPFENAARPRTSTYTRSLLVSLLSRTVVIRAGNDSEHRCEQLFRQRPPASDNIDRMVQVNRLILPSFYVYLE